MNLGSVFVHDSAFFFFFFSFPSFFFFLFSFGFGLNFSFCVRVFGSSKNIKHQISRSINMQVRLTPLVRRKFNSNINKSRYTSILLEYIEQSKHREK